MVKTVSLSRVMRKIGSSRITPFYGGGHREPGAVCALGAVGRWLGVCPYPYPTVDDFIQLYSSGRLGKDSKEFHLAAEVVRINDDSQPRDAITIAFLVFCNIKLVFDEHVRVVSTDIVLVEDEHDASHEA